MGVITWAGRSSKDFRVEVEHHPDYPMPERNVETVAVPGRNGDLHFDRGNYRNYTQRYGIYLSAGRDGLPTAADDVAGWLLAPTGYQRLEDSYNPDVYRMAYFAGPVDLVSAWNRFGRATLEFVCKPQRWLKSGEEMVICFASSVGMVPSVEFVNPTQFDALPYIKVYANEDSSLLYVNDTPCEFREIDEYIELDCELQNAYKGTQNLNNKVYIPEYPKLKPGVNVIRWDAGSQIKLDIIPRWWTL